MIRAKGIKTRNLFPIALRLFAARHPDLVLFGIVSLIGLAIFLRHDLTQLPLIRDNGVYIYMGQQIVGGHVLYRDVWIRKGPVTGLVTAMAIFPGRLLGLPDVISTRIAFLVISILCVGLMYVVAKDLFRSRWVGVASGLILTSVAFFAFSASIGPEPKTLVVLWTLIWLYSLQHRTWFWAGITGSLVVMTWLPGAFVVPLAIMASLWRPKEERWTGLLRALVGAIVPVVLVVVYFYLRGGFWDMLDQTLLFNLEYVVNPADVRGTRDFGLERFANVMQQGYPNELWLFVLAYLGPVLYFLSSRLARGGLWKAMAPHGPWLLTLAGLGFTLADLYDLQRFPDIIPLLPFVAGWSGWLIVKAVGDLQALLARFRVSSAPALEKTLQSMGLLVILLFGLQNWTPAQLGIQQTLAQQEEFISRLEQQLSPTDKIMVLGKFEIPVLLNRPNLLRYTHLMHGAERYIYEREPDGFEMIINAMKEQKPKLVALSRLPPSDDVDHMLEWLMDNYDLSCYVPRDRESGKQTTGSLRKYKEMIFLRRPEGISVDETIEPTGMGVLSTPGSMATAPADSQARAEYLVIVVLDAFRPDYVEIAPTPNIDALKRAGVSYERAWVGHVANNTPPGHATIVTGVFPAHHGAISFSWRVPQTGVIQHIPDEDDENPIYDPGYLTRVIDGSGVPALTSVIKQHLPDAKALAISGRFFAASPMGAGGADYIVFSRNPYKQRGEQLPLIPAAVEGYEPPASIMQDPNLTKAPIHCAGDLDTWTMDVALAIIQQEKPRLVFINLSETDWSGHRTGSMANPRLMRPVIANVDAQLGRLMGAYRQADILHKTLFVITADHGMLFNERNIPYKKSFRLANEVALEDKGAFVFPYLWLTDPDEAGRVAEQIERLNVPGVIGAYFRSKGGDSYELGPGSRLRVSAELDAAYRYLLSTFAGPSGPDVVIVSQDNAVFPKRRKRRPEGEQGSHAPITWTSQHIPLIIAGPGVKKGVVSQAPARLVDIAPTVLAAMGIEPPDTMDGIVLADALLRPTQDQVEKQISISQVLAPYQEALIADSAKPELAVRE